MKELSVFPTGKRTQRMPSISSDRATLIRFRPNRSIFPTSPLNRAAEQLARPHRQEGRRTDPHLHRRRRMVPGMGPAGKKTETGRCRQYPDRRKTLARRHERQRFQHIAIAVPGEECGNEWLEPVSDEDYSKLDLIEGGNENGKSNSRKRSARRIPPEFAHLNHDVLFGEVWAREDKLSPKLRSIVTVTALMASGSARQLAEVPHFQSKGNGVTQEEMAEILTHAAFYAGWPKAWAAFNFAKEVYKD